MNGSSIRVDWDKPVDDYILTGNTSYPARENLIIENSVNQVSNYTALTGMTCHSLVLSAQC